MRRSRPSVQYSDSLTLAVAVAARASRSNGRLVLPRPRDDVLREDGLGVGVVDAAFGRKIAKSEDLPVVGDGLLFDRVRVAHIREDDLASFGLEGFGLHDHLSAHGVLLLRVGVLM